MLFLADYLREPAIRSAIQALRLPSGSRGLDVGCGIGQHTLWLAEAVGANGHVVGLDISAELLAWAEQNAKQSSLSDRVTFEKGDLNRLPFENESFDWLWSADALWIGSKDIGCPAEEALPLIKELSRAVKTGGSLAILFWSAQKLLPGYPLLEVRFNTTRPANAPFVEGMKPELHALCALGWLRNSGLENLSVRTFAASVHAPLNEKNREALVGIFQMLWGEAQPEMTEADRLEFQRLCRPESPDCILNSPDYYALLTYSLFHGKVTRRDRNG
jgi:demethylmenaquinone methyltransferase/2-methoxy-6-polyprenyl-1,4-benzoquinol methylase